MATKTISIELDVYLRLKRLRSSPSESFSKVLRRTLPSEDAGVSARELLLLSQRASGVLSATPEQLSSIEQARLAGDQASDPWVS